MEMEKHTYVHASGSSRLVGRRLEQGRPRGKLGVELLDGAVQSTEKFRRERDTRMGRALRTVVILEDGGVVEDTIGCHPKLEARDLTEQSVDDPIVGSVCLDRLRYTRGCQVLKSVVRRTLAPHYLCKESANDEDGMHLLPGRVMGKARHRGVVHLQEVLQELKLGHMLCFGNPPRVVTVQDLELTEVSEFAGARESRTLQPISVIAEHKDPSKIGNLLAGPLLLVGLGLRIALRLRLALALRLAFRLRSFRLGFGLLLGNGSRLRGWWFSEERLWAGY